MKTKLVIFAALLCVPVCVPVFAQEPGAALRQTQGELAQQVAALATNDEVARRKKTVLSYQVQLLGKAIAQQEWQSGEDIVADIKFGLAANIGRSDLKQPWLRPVWQRENNPYLAPELNEKWVAPFNDRPDDDWKLATAKTNAFDGLNGAFGTRAQADNAAAWLLLYSHPQSPLRGRDELLIRALRRTDAYMRSYHWHETLQSNAHLNDFFALGPALMAAAFIDKTYPELLLPKQRALWLAAAQKAAQRYTLMNYNGNYSNADLGTARIFLASALFTGNAQDFAHGVKLALSWKENIFPDGGSSYIAKQNESQGYHDACINIEYDNYLLTGDERLLEILRSVQMYPISASDSNGTAEWFTAPSWKQSWYSAPAIGGSPVVFYLTGNPYFRALPGPERFDAPTVPSVKLALIYKSHPAAARPLPNDYTVYDRNIQGVRMNYGLWSAAMNGRVTEQLVGKNTYVGLTLAEAPPNNAKAFSAALYGINAFPVFDGGCSNTISDESISVTAGGHVAALGADYRLATRLAGPSRKNLPWKGRQTWLFLPHRLIGVLELSPEGAQKANGVTVNLELGRTKKGALDKSALLKIDERNFKYGNLLITIHDTNFKAARIESAPDNLSCDGNRGPHNELHLVDEASAAAWPKNQIYNGTFYAVVELRSITAGAAAQVQRITAGEVLGVSAQTPEGRFTALYNSGAQAANFATAAFVGPQKSSLFADRSSFAPPAAVPANATLAPKSSLVLASAAEAKWHQNAVVGWPALLAQSEKEQTNKN